LRAGRRLELATSLGIDRESLAARYVYQPRPIVVASIPEIYPVRFRNEIIHEKTRSDEEADTVALSVKICGEGETAWVMERRNCVGDEWRDNG
jgi:hypothetical protein